MAKGKFVAYYRVSTHQQGESGLGLEAQQAAVRAHLNGGNWELIAEFTEVESGKNNARPQLAAALKHCRLSGATLVVARLDRLSRNAAFLANLMESKVRFVCVDNPHANQLTIGILAYVAEDERKRISERTKAALAAAKARGVRLGNPRLADFRSRDPARAIAKRQELASAYAAEMAEVVEDIQRLGIHSLSGIARALNARGLTTRRRCKWSPMAVSRLLDRLRGAAA
jgi:DNA invertase Pin-like site-specific DNA recombinase